jgi:hypothetical protein
LTLRHIDSFHSFARRSPRRPTSRCGARPSPPRPPRRPPAASRSQMHSARGGAVPAAASRSAPLPARTLSLPDCDGLQLIATD